MESTRAMSESVIEAGKNDEDWEEDSGISAGEASVLSMGVTGDGEISRGVGSIHC